MGNTSTEMVDDPLHVTLPECNQGNTQIDKKITTQASHWIFVIDARKEYAVRALV